MTPPVPSLHDHLQRRRRLARTLRDAIWRMRSREDMQQVLSELREGLLGLDIPHLYFGVNRVDRSVTPHVVVSHGMGPNGEWRRLESGAGTVVGFWRSGQVVYRADLSRDDPYDEARYMGRVRSIVDVPFAQGTLAVNSVEPEAFSPEVIDLLQEMAGLLEDGFNRLDELRRIEVRVAVREKVWQMRTTDDIEEVLFALHQAFDEYGLRYHTCGLNVIHLDHLGPGEHVVMAHNMTRGGGWTQIYRGPEPLVQAFWRGGVPVYRRDLQVDDPHGERSAISTYYGQSPRAVIDIPFSHGTLALNSTEPDAFSDADVAQLVDLARLLDEGFRRLDDLRALEERNRRLEREVDERRRAEADLEQSLAEKDILLREVHHRVKNNLQVVCSLLSLRAESLTDEAAVRSFTDSRAQIESMAMIHERLYEAEDLSRIEGDGFLRDLATSVLVSYGADPQRVRLRVDVAPEVVTVDTAIQCGLIVHELVSNALKYAFADGRVGTIHVEGQRLESGLSCLRVRDDGVGLPADFAAHGSLGLLLVEDLARKLGGGLTVGGDPGACFEVRFPAQRRR